MGGVGKQAEGLLPRMLVDARSVHPRFHHHEDFGGRFGSLDEGSCVHQRWDADLNTSGKGWGEVLRWLPQPRGDGKVLDDASQLHGLDERGHPEGVCPRLRHDRCAALRTVPVRVRLDHAHEAGRGHRLLHASNIVGNSVEVNGGF